MNAQREVSSSPGVSVHGSNFSYPCLSGQAPADGAALTVSSAVLDWHPRL